MSSCLHLSGATAVYDFSYRDVIDELEGSQVGFQIVDKCDQDWHILLSSKMSYLV
jgi:hypothetical protein